MANKIVQLENKAGDNLYPLAGGMAANSVTTAMIQDGAITNAKLAENSVTSDNIDFTTLTGAWVYPNNTYPYSGYCIVGGNLFINVHIETATSLPAFGSLTLWRLPDDYTAPNAVTVPCFVRVQGSTDFAPVYLRINANGYVTLFNWEGAITAEAIYASVCVPLKNS